MSGGATAEIGAVLIGGYFGGWASVEDLWELPLDPIELAEAQLGFGCGLIGLLDAEACGVRATARRDQYRISQMTVGNGGAFLAQPESAVLALDGGDTGSDMAADTGFGRAGSDQ